MFNPTQADVRRFLCGVHAKAQSGAPMEAIETLASLPDDELQSRLSTLPLQRHTAHTATDLPTLLERIRQARTQGWCLVNQELEEGLISIAAPLTNRLGQTVAALNISGQANRTSAELMQQTLLPPLLRAAQTISRLMGAARR